MTRDEALVIISQLTFRPDWAIRASAVPGTRRRIQLELAIETADTSYPSPDGSYEVPLTETPSVQLDAALYDSEEALLRRVLTAVAEFSEHEDREFLRIRRGDGRWEAPLHPHTQSGREAWKRTASK